MGSENTPGAYNSETKTSRPLTWSDATGMVRARYPEDWQFVQQRFLEQGNNNLAARARKRFREAQAREYARTAKQRLNQAKSRTLSHQQLFELAVELKRMPQGESASKEALNMAIRKRQFIALKEHKRRRRSITISFTAAQSEVIDRVFQAAKKANPHWTRTKFLNLVLMSGLVGLDRTEWFQESSKDQDRAGGCFDLFPMIASSPVAIEDCFVSFQAECQLILAEVKAEFEDAATAP